MLIGISYECNTLIDEITTFRMLAMQLLLLKTNNIFKGYMLSFEVIRK
jgi:hypothetical protein